MKRRLLAWLVALGGCLALAGCPDKPAPPLASLAPTPLPRDDHDAPHRVELAPEWGDALPASAVTVELSGSVAQLGAQHFETDDPSALGRLIAKLATASILLAPDRDTYLAQAAPLLAALDDAGRETWLASQDRKWAFPVKLRDEPAFQRWLDEATPGKIRIIQRADGFELQTNVGKLPGPDPNGPSVPVRGGNLDVATLRSSLARLKERFGEAPDLCLVPSFGTELARAADALSGDYSEPRRRIFDGLCLVYPRPARRDGG